MAILGSKLTRQRTRRQMQENAGREETSGDERFQRNGLLAPGGQKRPSDQAALLGLILWTGRAYSPQMAVQDKWPTPPPARLDTGHNNVLRAWLPPVCWLDPLRTTFVVCRIRGPFCCRGVTAREAVCMGRV